MGTFSESYYIVPKLLIFVLISTEFQFQYKHTFHMFCEEALFLTDFGKSPNLRKLMCQLFI